jgi:xanthine/CO dehydrogenase XdhC/CoxF family maturation factor
MTEHPPDPPQNVLVIDCPEAMRIAENLEPPPMVISIAFRQLSRMLLEVVAPDCVALPLLGSGFDAVQVIERLRTFRYTGRICAIAPDLPDAALVAAELTALADGIPVHVITPGQYPGYRSR